MGFFDSSTSKSYERHPLLWGKYLMLQTSLLVYLSIPNQLPSFPAPKVTWGAMSCPQLQPYTLSLPAQPPQHRQPPVPAPPASPISRLQNLVTKALIVSLFTRDLAVLSPTGSFSLLLSLLCRQGKWGESTLSFTQPGDVDGEEQCAWLLQTDPQKSKLN